MSLTQTNNNKFRKIKKLPVFTGERELQKFLETSFTDNLKQLIRVTVQIMVKSEMEVFREQFEEKLQFNGNYFRQMLSLFGKVKNVPVPRFRREVSDLNLKTLNIFNEEKEKFAELIGQMHLMGISQRKIKQITKICFHANISKDRVGAIYKELAEKEEININNQLLNDDFEYLILDGIWEKTKGYGWEDNKSTLLCALGIKTNGERKILGFSLERAENIENWKQLLTNIKKRGLKGSNLKLIIADDHSSIKTAVDLVFSTTPIQICIVHKMRNAIGKTKHKNKQAMAEDLKTIFQGQNENEAISKAKQVIKKWYITEKSATESLRHNIEYCFTYMRFPKEIWSKIRTTNILEREFREVRRRMKGFDNTFQNVDSANRYANTIFSYLNNNYPLK